MASLSLGAATRTLTSTAFLKSAVLVVGGSLFSQVLTDWMRSNVVDISMAGGDAVYALTAAFLALMVLPGALGRSVALGSGATAVRVVANDFGLF